MKKMINKIAQIFKNTFLKEDNGIFISGDITITNTKTGEVIKFNKSIKEKNGLVEFNPKGIFVNGKKIED